MESLLRSGEFGRLAFQNYIPLIAAALVAAVIGEIAHKARLKRQRQEELRKIARLRRLIAKKKRQLRRDALMLAIDTDDAAGLAATEHHRPRHPRGTKQVGQKAQKGRSPRESNPADSLNSYIKVQEVDNTLHSDMLIYIDESAREQSAILANQQFESESENYRRGDFSEPDMGHVNEIDFALSDLGIRNVGEPASGGALAEAVTSEALVDAHAASEYAK